MVHVCLGVVADVSCFAVSNLCKLTDFGSYCVCYYVLSSFIDIL